MARTQTLCGVAALAAALLTGAPAGAQWNNQPYDYRGGGPGISTAYRQAIIDQELFGREPRNLVRGPGGTLVEVIRRDGQAFLAEREPRILVQPSGADSPTPWRFGIGGIGAGAGPIDQWIALLE